MEDNKALILNAAYLFMDMLEDCQDDNFVEDVINAISNNDKALLWDLEDELERVSVEGEDY